MSNDIEYLLDSDATACAAAVRSGEVTPLQLVDAAIERIVARDPAVGALSWERFDQARAEAAAHSGTGPFAGVPFLLKDLEMPMEGEPSYSGSHLARAADVRADTTAPLVTRFQRAGFVILGATRPSEFGVAAISVPMNEPPVSNPWDPRRNAGGSSGGAAAAVAAGMVPCAHASDGAGSIRTPAAFCGVVGLKPSRGRISSAPFDTGAGVAVDFAVTRSVRDTAAMLDAVAGPEPGDSIVAPAPAEPYAVSIERPPTSLRIGMMTSFPAGNGVVDPAIVRGVEAAAITLESLGHTVVDDYPDVLEDLDWMIDVAVTLIAVGMSGVAAELESELGRPIGPGDMEPVNLALAHRGQNVSLADFSSAMESFNIASRRAAAWWEQGFDMLIHPSTAGVSPINSEFAFSAEDETDEGGYAWFVRMAHRIAYPPVWNLTGQPALSVPSVLCDGLPTAVQIVGRYGREDLVLGVGRQLEQSSPWPLVAPWPPRPRD